MRTARLPPPTSSENKSSPGSQNSPSCCRGIFIRRTEREFCGELVALWISDKSGHRPQATSFVLLLPSLLPLELFFNQLWRGTGITWGDYKMCWYFCPMCGGSDLIGLRYSPDAVSVFVF